MHRIMFVCHGNICRSPMAEFVMKDLVARAGREGEFEIASAATSAEELGNPVHPGTVRILKRMGISCAGKRARRVSADEYDAWDLIIGMDEANMANLRRLFKGDPQNKIHKLMEFAGKRTSRNAVPDVADPWYTGDFETTHRDIFAGCKGLLERIGGHGIG